jgi:hypothetical protein
MPASMALLIAGINALGSQPTTIIPAGFRADVYSTASTNPGYQQCLGQQS